MQNSVNVGKAEKRWWGDIYLKARLPKKVRFWVFLVYTPGWVSCWAVEGFPRGRRRLFCRHPQVWCWRRTGLFCTWLSTWRRWTWLKIIRGCMIVCRLDCGDQLAKLAKSWLRHFLGQFFEFCEPVIIRWGKGWLCCGRCRWWWWKWWRGRSRWRRW